MKLFAILAAVFSTTAAFANPFENITPENPVCFEREYTEGHMDRHPLQTVKQMTMKYSTEPRFEGAVLLDIKALIKRPSKKRYTYNVYSTTMFCSLKTESLECSIDCDGGNATVAWDVQSGDGDEIVFKNKGFVMYGGCGSDVDMDDTIWLDAKKGGDDVFKLYRMDDNACRALKISDHN